MSAQIAWLRDFLATTYPSGNAPLDLLRVVNELRDYLAAAFRTFCKKKPA